MYVMLWFSKRLDIRLYTSSTFFWRSYNWNIFHSFGCSLMAVRYCREFGHSDVISRDCFSILHYYQTWIIFLSICPSFHSSQNSVRPLRCTWAILWDDPKGVTQVQLCNSSYSRSFFKSFLLFNPQLRPHVPAKCFRSKLFKYYAKKCDSTWLYTLKISKYHKDKQLF